MAKYADYARKRKGDEAAIAVSALWPLGLLSGGELIAVIELIRTCPDLSLAIEMIVQNTDRTESERKAAINSTSLGVTGALIAAASHITDGTGLDSYVDAATDSLLDYVIKDGSSDEAASAEAFKTADRNDANRSGVIALVKRTLYRQYAINAASARAVGAFAVGGPGAAGLSLGNDAVQYITSDS